ncbi:MAG: TonB-dependent receptor plug domain-containing protein [Candidatus Omnitrophica bacterium]|nr:TonB-dependent receptor plug domain-containing protein [Candidatus Omnitrophota bacterium]
MRKFVFFVLSCLFLSSIEALAWDKITVVKKTYPSVSFEDKVNPGNSGLYFPVSLESSLRSQEAVDLRTRSGFGIQQDLCLDGASYQQTAVLLDGVKINDPQTAHYNLDIPLTIFDLEKTGIYKQGGASLYGAGSLAGAVDFRLKKPTGNNFETENAFGEHALFINALSASFLNKDGLGVRSSFEQKISKSDPANTDFESHIASFYLSKEEGDFSFNQFLGFQEKNFGASTFYSNLFPEEEEHTRTLLLKSSLNKKAQPGEWAFNFYWRRHDDKFILSRHESGNTNWHTTYLYGLDSSCRYKLGFIDSTSAVYFSREQIDSTNLGIHNRNSQAFSQKANLSLGTFFLSLAARADYYQTSAFKNSYNLSIWYPLIEERLKINYVFDRSVRMPSFTELYYNDSANKGNSSLKEEKADNFSFNLDYSGQNFSSRFGIFLRKVHSLIDWVRQNSSLPWQADNLGRVDFRGANFLFLKGPFELSYNYILPDKKQNGYLSKYALDVLRHQAILKFTQNIFSCDWAFELSYNRRYYSEGYFLGNFTLSKTFRLEQKEVVPFLKVDNFSDTQYTQISDVKQPGRWIWAGIKLKW